MVNKIKVALTSAENRAATVFQALDFFKDDLNRKIATLNPKEDYILIKPNCVVANNADCATHLETLKTLLEFLAPLWSGRTILAEGSAENTFQAFENYGFYELKKAYPELEFLDLNYADAIFIDVLDRDLKSTTLKISNTVIEAPLRISVGPPKTHDSVIVTLSIKNLAVGAILKEDKAQIHQGPRAINRTIAEINKYTFPHFALIDGWQAMEGEGPIRGKMKETRFCLASMNALAADCLAAKLMGFDPLKIGYLNLSGAESVLPLIVVSGQDPAKFQFQLKPHPGYQEQLQWQ